jgi:cobalamin-dependent methionine synthase I
MSSTVGSNAESRPESFHRALVDYDRIQARRIFLDHDAADPLNRIENLIVPALEQIGDGWADGRMSLSQVYMSGKICEELVRESLPVFLTDGAGGSEIALAVFEDRHMLGKRIVYSVLSAHGYRIDDYGAVVSIVFPAPKSASVTSGRHSEPESIG